MTAVSAFLALTAIITKAEKDCYERATNANQCEIAWSANNADVGRAAARRWSDKNNALTKMYFGEDKKKGRTRRDLKFKCVRRIRVHVKQVDGRLFGRRATDKISQAYGTNRYAYLHRRNVIKE